MLSFTLYTQSVSLGKCSTIVSNRFTTLSFNIVRCSNIHLSLVLRPTDVDYYVVCLAYVVRQLSLIKSVLPKVVISCFPTYSTSPILCISTFVSDACSFGLFILLYYLYFMNSLSPTGFIK